MLITVPAETKASETRVALTPDGTRLLTADGHEVWVQAGAGLGSAFTDDEYVAAGARLVAVDEAWSGELVLKVKEPVPEEYSRLTPNTLFTYLHLAANEPLARALIAAGTTALSYDTVQLDDGSLPLLAPMSAVAGRMAPIVGAYHLLSSQGGRGVLLAGAPGAPRGRVVVIGAGVAGSNAVEESVGLGAACDGARRLTASPRRARGPVRRARHRRPLDARRCGGSPRYSGLGDWRSPGAGAPGPEGGLARDG